MMGRQRWVIVVFAVILLGLTVWFQVTKVAYIDPEVQINPSRHYTLEFWDYPLPIMWEDGSNYHDLVQKLIADFEGEHPNISINYRPFSFSQGTEPLVQALRKGSPPDVYSEPFPQAVIYHQGLQVPITDFLEPEERDSYYPEVLASLEREGDLWGWPAWFSPLIWAGNRQFLERTGLDIEGVQTLGWNWEEFLATGRNMVSGGEAGGIVFATGPGEIELFTNLLCNTGLSPFAEVGEDEEKVRVMVRETAAFVSILWSEGLWQKGREDTFWLEDFWAGRAAVVGPVNTWVLRGAETRVYQDRHHPELVFLPPPHRIGARESLEPTVASVRVFRQHRFQGADQVKAAMEFARYFSQKQGQAVAPRLWSLPAYQPWSWVDKGEMELSSENARFLLRSVKYLLPPPGDWRLWQKEQKWKKEQLSPGLEELLAGEITPEELAAQVLSPRD